MTNLANYAVIAKSRDELMDYMNNHDKFTSVMRDDLNWFIELGFTQCKLYHENTEYTRNYYKVFGNEILVLNLRTQDIMEGQFDIRKKIRLVNNELVLNYLHAYECDIDFDSSLVFPNCIVSSVDKNHPSMVSYLTIKIEDSYYDESKYKKITTYVNIDKIEFIQDDSSDFYLANVIFMDKKLEKFKVVTDGIERDGELLSEFIEQKPTVSNFFNYDKQFDSNMKFLFSALVI
jgi:hypothetical protein